MENHYTFVREIRKRMRLEEQIIPEELIDYYWSLHRLHEYQARSHESQIRDSQNGQMEGHVLARKRHYQKALEYRKMAEEFEEKVYPGLLGSIGVVDKTETSSPDKDGGNYQI
jgi:hypothetical protein